MISRPGHMQQPTSTDQSLSRTSADRSRCRTSDRRHSPTRSGREATFAREALLFVVVALLLMVWAAHTTRLGSSLPEVTTVAVHTVTPQCVSAEDMARAYGFRGDWREYMMAVKELNGWDRWPILYGGDPVFVPDYRSNEEVAYGSVGPTQQSHRRRAEAYPAGSGGIISGITSDPSGSTHQNSSAVDSRNQQLDRRETLRPSTGRPVEAHVLLASPQRQGRAARPILHE